MEETLKILVVDDDEVDRMAVRRALQAAGVQMDLAEVSDCASAIAYLQQSPCDCVFLDYLLPDGDGLFLVQQIRSAQIKVALVVLTGQGDEQIAVSLMKAGVSDYLSKYRISPQNLARSLHSAIRLNRAEIQAAEANQKLRDSEERFRCLVQNSSDIITILNGDGTARYISPSIQQILGYHFEDLTGQNLFQYVHPEDLRQVQLALTDIFQHLGIAPAIEFRFRHALGHWIAIEAVANNLLNDPSIQGVVINARDVSERKQAEAEIVKLNRYLEQRVTEQRFLAEASDLLSTSLDYQTTLENLARLVVPYLADWCTIHVSEPDRSLRQVAAAHREADKLVQLQELQDCYPLNPEQPYGITKVAQTGQLEFYPQMPASILKRIARNPEHLQTLQELQLRSVMSLPLVARGRTLGVITFVRTSSQAYTSTDLALAEDLARRAALSMDNARLYRESQEVGENLRQAILILGEQQQQLRTLQRLTNLLNRRLADLPGLLQTLVRAICGAIPGAEFGLITLSNPENRFLELTAQAGKNLERFQEASFPYLQSQLLNPVFFSGELQLLQTPPPQKKPGSALDSELPPIPASVCGVAIESAQAGRLGVLAIGNWENLDAFDEDDRGLLIAFGEQAAIAINNARLINTLEEREERLAIQNETLLKQNIELDQQRQRIQAQNLKLIESAQLKSQFLATMSHELRTPMNAIMGFSQLLLRQQHRLNPQQMDMVERILNNGKNLLLLINDILDLSKLEAGRMELKPETLNLEKLVVATVTELRSLADQKHLPLVIIGKLNNPWIVNDGIRLRQILNNLISNAIKFTETGRVQIRLLEQADDTLCLSVEDTGIGISETDLDNIFEKFRQVDQSLTKKYSGTGLGLAITDWLVRIMQGRITVRSKLGEGSTFQVELPRSIQVEAAQKYSSQHSSNAANRRILL